ncbi:MAG: hypothetical protein RIR70_2031, partial [Pseudomonadota bacterium]
MSTHPFGLATLTQIGEFDEIVDARSPAEFAEDHLPGAINCPVLDDAERAEIGTLYKQVSPFEARKRGAVYVAENIARHLAARFQGKPKSWRPLIYCWRGGQRSGAFTTWLRMIGWDARQLEGGYKVYRQDVLRQLDTLPTQFQFRVLCGATGSGKTRLLHALAGQGAQTLDLEALAAHRGSVLGALPHTPQPSQKLFESHLLAALRGFDRGQVIFIEAESRKIGERYLPTALLSRIRQSACVMLEASLPARLRLLLEDYAWLGEARDALIEKLNRIAPLHSRETLNRWRGYAERGALKPLFSELIAEHYDPLYQRSERHHFGRLPIAARLSADDLSPESLRALAKT